MRVAVASGKGGTGKTLVSTSLARWLAQQSNGDQSVTYLDADVEAPNGHLYLKPRWAEERRFTVEVPDLRGASCSGCGACQEACAFNAIIALPKNVLIFNELCHACRGCLLACEEDALVMVPREIGTIRWGQSGALVVRDALLDIGEAKAPPLIDGLLDAIKAPQSGTVIVDAPPGTSCSAVTVAQQVDRLLLVTEPTPFGLHDLKLAVGMCRAVGRPVQVVINRSDLGDLSVKKWLEEQQIPLVAEIPYSEDIARCYARGTLAVDHVPAFRRAVEAVAHALLFAAEGVIP